MLRLPGINQAQFAASLVTNRDLSLMDRHMRQMLQVGDRLFEMCDQAMQINEMLATGRVTRASVEALYGDIIGDNNRVIRTSMEGVSDMASDAWAALKNWFKEMIRKVQDFFLKYSVFIKRTKESLKKLITYVKNGLSGSSENYWCVDVLGGYSMEAAKNIKIPEDFEDRLTLAADEQVLTKRTANSAKAYYKDWRRHIERMLDDKSSKSEIKKILSRLKGEIKTTKLPKLAYALKTHIEQLEKSLDVIEEVVDKKDRSGYDQLPKWIQNKLNQIPAVKNNLSNSDDQSDQNKNGQKNQNDQDKDKDKNKDDQQAKGQDDQQKKVDNDRGASGNANNNGNESLPNNHLYKYLFDCLRVLKESGVINEQKLTTIKTLYNSNDIKNLNALISNIEGVKRVVSPHVQDGWGNFVRTLDYVLDICQLAQRIDNTDVKDLEQLHGRYEMMSAEAKAFITKYQSVNNKISEYSQKKARDGQEQSNGNNQGQSNGNNGQGQPNGNNQGQSNGNNQGQSNGNGQDQANGNNGQSNNNGQGQPGNNGQGQSNNNGQGQSNGNNGQGQSNGNNQGQSNGNNGQGQSNGNGQSGPSVNPNPGGGGSTSNPTGGSGGGSADGGTAPEGAPAGGASPTSPSTPPPPPPTSQPEAKAKYTYKLSNLSEDQKDKFNDVKILSLDTLPNVFNTYAAPAKEVSVLNAALAKDISGDELTLKLDNNVSDKLEKLLDTDQGDSGIKLMDLDTGQKAIQQLEAYVKFADQIIKFREACVKDYVRTYRTCEKFKGNMKRDMLNNVRAVLHQRLLIAYKVSSEFRKSVVNLHKFVLSVLRLNTERAA